MKKLLIVATILLFAISTQAQKVKLDTLSDGRIMLIVKGDTIETFKASDGYKRFIIVAYNKKGVVQLMRKNIFRREPKENSKHYEFAKF